MERSYQSLAVLLGALSAALAGVGNAPTAVTPAATAPAHFSLGASVSSTCGRTSAVTAPTGRTTDNTVRPVVYVVVLPAADGSDDATSKRACGNLQHCTRDGYRFPVVLADGEEKLLVGEPEEQMTDDEDDGEDDEDADDLEGGPSVPLAPPADDATDNAGEIVADGVQQQSIEEGETEIQLEISNRFSTKFRWSEEARPAPPVQIEEAPEGVATSLDDAQELDWEMIVYRQYLLDLTGEQGTLKTQLWQLQLDLCAARVRLWLSTDWLGFAAAKTGAAVETLPQASSRAAALAVRGFVAGRPAAPFRRSSKSSPPRSRLAEDCGLPVETNVVETSGGSLPSRALLAASATFQQYGGYLQAMTKRLTEMVSSATADGRNLETTRQLTPKAAEAR